MSSVIFAAAHTHHGLKLIISSTFQISVLLGLIAVWTDSILLPIAIHCGTAGGKQSALLGSGIWLVYASTRMRMTPEPSAEMHGEDIFGSAKDGL